MSTRPGIKSAKWAIESIDSNESPSPNDRWFGLLLVNGQGTARQVFRRNRDFDPASGQFTQADPIGIADGMNLWGIAGGDPANFSDPFGLFSCPPDCPTFFGSDAFAVFRRLAAMAPATEKSLTTAATVNLAPAAIMASGIGGVTTLGLTAQSAAAGAGLGIIPSAIGKVNAVANQLGISGGTCSGTS